MSDIVLLQSERDALVMVGLLAHAYLIWDPPVHAGKDSSGNADFTHYNGLNIEAMIIDNADGEVLALTKNSIHGTENPVYHAEQAAIRVAVERLRVKRPRPAGMTVENYYRSQLFYKAGTTDDAYLLSGCTLYSTLEPCPMCTATLCVCRMKRIVFLINDKKYGGSYGTPATPGIKDSYYKSYDLRYEQLMISRSTPFLEEANMLHAELSAAIETMRGSGVQDTWFLDRVHPLLKKALDILIDTTMAKLTNVGIELDSVNKTLSDLKRICRLP